MKARIFRWELGLHVSLMVEEEKKMGKKKTQLFFEL